MSDVINGGISITLGSYILQQISQYSPSWVFEEKETFENWDYTQVSIPKGRRFQLTVTANNLNTARKNALLNALFATVFSLECPDYTGMVKVINVGQPIKKATRFGIWYDVTFSLAAVELAGSGGSL